MRLGLSHYAFRFDKIDGSFDYDPKNPEATKVTVTIDSASFASMDKPIDDRIESNEFLDIAKYPQIQFVSTAIKRTGGNKGTMTGNVTFLGHTAPVTLDVTFHGMAVGRRTTMGFSASTVIKIADFSAAADAFVKSNNLGTEVPLDIQALFDKT